MVGNLLILTNLQIEYLRNARDESFRISPCKLLLIVSFESENVAFLKKEITYESK